MYRRSPHLKNQLGLTSTGISFVLLEDIYTLSQLVLFFIIIHDVRSIYGILVGQACVENNTNCGFCVKSAAIGTFHDMAGLIDLRYSAKLEFSRGSKKNVRFKIAAAKI